MATEPVAQTSSAEAKDSVEHSTPSWADRLLAGITRLPIPAWIFYPALLMALMLVNNGLQWMDGTLPPGTFDQVRSSDVVYPVYFLALMHYLNTFAGRALEKFRPVTELSEPDYARLSHELQTAPARPALVAGIVGMAFALLAIVSGPISFGIFPRSSLLTILFVGGWSLFAGAIIFVFILHTVHQLHLVNQIYRRATRINLLELKSVYALSALTARAGLGLIFFLYFAFAINSLGTLSITTDQLTFTLYGGLFLTGIAAFVLPLRGIHRRLVAEKDLKISEVNDRFAAAVAKLHQDVDTGNFDKMDGTHKAVASLVLEREQLEKISTWPWEKVTLRAFVTAIMIPIMLWLLTRLLDRLLNF